MGDGLARRRGRYSGNILFDLRRRGIGLDVAGHEMFAVRVLGLVILFKAKQVTPAQRQQQFVVWQTQDFVRRQKRAAPHGLAEPVLRSDLRYRYGLPHGHLRLHIYGHFAGPLTEVFSGKQIRASKQHLYVQVAENLGPLMVRKPALELAQTLDNATNADSACAQHA